MIEVKCDACGSKLEAPASAAGRLSKCPYCREAVQIPATAASVPVRPNETKQEIPAVSEAEKTPTTTSKKTDTAKAKGKRTFRKNEPKAEPVKEIRVGGKKITTAKKAKDDAKGKGRKKSPYAPKPKKPNGTAKVFAGLAAAVVLGLVLLQTKNATDSVRSEPEVVADEVAADGGALAYNTPEMKAAVERIDKIIADAQQKAGVTPNPPASDDIWMRRAHLDISGAIAPYRGAIAFLYDENENRRETLVDGLLKSEGYTSHTFNYFADIWRVRTVVEPSKIRMEAFIHWMKQQIHENRPYNEMVYDMVVAEGRLWDNPATGWHMRDSGTKLDHVSYMTKSLLGTDIACAQCHNDPHDHWEQKQYYEFASFLSELRTTQKKGKRGYHPGNKLATALVEREDVRALMGAENAPRETEEDIVRLRRRANGPNRIYREEIFAPYQLKIRDERASLLTLPVNFKYKNGFPSEAVKPHVILGQRRQMIVGRTPRQKLAKWVTSPKNPWFARNIANHMWYRMFGRAVVEPLHDADQGNPHLPGLLDVLAEEVVRLNYDLRAVTWMIAQTDAYQREATRDVVKVTEPYYFQGPLLRRMSAEQIWDSFVTLSVEDPLRYRSNPGGDYHTIINLAENQKKNSVTVEDIIFRGRALSNYKRNHTVVDSQAMGGTKMLEGKDGTGLSGMMGGFAMVDSGGSGGGGAMMGDSMMAGGSMMSGGAMMSGDAMMGNSMMGGGKAKSTTVNKPGDQMMMAMMGSGRNAKKMILTRASELEQPANRSHFLHKFGQSERNFQINAVSKEGSVPQVMALMNGDATAFVCSPASMVFKNVKRTSLQSQRASTVFLTILNRRPSEEEAKIIANDVETTHNGVTDLIWALLNSPEFMFIQ